ncbi:MAG: 50S ribosomal protein L10 [Oscillospiraceae bacterium]|nr:50S ribosomal protein L10 [Oscillospiraceae bacterium]
MPSEVILRQKQQEVAELTEMVKAATTGVIVDYKGISVLNDTKLRKELREAGVRYMVVKNSLLRRAMENAGMETVNDVLVGSTAIAISPDYSTAAKILVKYAEASRGKFAVKAGFVEGEVLGAEGVKKLSDLPSREELVAMVLRGFNAPISGFANVLNANIRGLVIALNQIAESGRLSA